MVSDGIQKTHLDDVLGQFNMFGAYHLQLMLLIGLAYASNTAFSDQYIFAAEEVKYRCANPALVNNTCGTINSTMCTEWIYDKPDSFVAEFQLACQDWKRTLVGTIRSAAYMCGLLVVGPLSDRLGRKPMIIMTGVIGGMLGIAKSFATSYWLYIVLEILESAFGDICAPVYILNVEIIATKKRIPYFMVSTIGYSLGGVWMALIARLFPNWRHFLRVLYAPALLFFFFLFCIDESPRWLLIKGKKKEAVKLIQKMAKKNKIELDQNELHNLTCKTDENEDLKFSAVLKSTFCSPPLFKRFAVCVTWWITSTLVYYGMAIISVSLQGDKYMNYSLTIMSDVPGVFIVTFVVMKYRRKYPLIASFLIAGVFCVGQPFLPANLTGLSIMMFMIGKLMSSLYFNITFIYTSELFPTYTRTSMLSLCSSLGRIGSILAPQTPLLVVYWVGLPSIIFGLASALTGLITFLVPDIADISLPDTVKEAEAIGVKENAQTKEMVL